MLKHVLALGLITASGQFFNSTLIFWPGTITLLNVQNHRNLEEESLSRLHISH